jgi:hypothetical protein
VGVTRRLSSGASPQASTRTVADAGAHTRRRFATAVAPGDPRNGGRYGRSCLDYSRMALLPRLGSLPGSPARHRTPVPPLGAVASRALRDTTDYHITCASVLRKEFWGPIKLMLRIPYKVLFISISCLLIFAWRLDSYGRALLVLIILFGGQLFLGLRFGVIYTNYGTPNVNESPGSFWTAFICNALFFGLVVSSFITDLRNNGRFIIHVFSGKCIDIAGAPGKVNGAQLQLWECESSGVNRDNGSPTDQKWQLTSDGLIKNTLSGKCINVGGAPGTTNGAPLLLWECEFSDVNRDKVSPTDQKWRLR